MSESKSLDNPYELALRDFANRERRFGGLKD